jgi:colanic acid/amylovoran biosynthesis glycosyltransferase
VSEPLAVGLVVSRLPKLSETFVLFEALALEEQGVRVVPLPLKLERATVSHPEAAAFVARARAAPPWSWPVLRAQLRWLHRRPRAYLGAWAGALAGNRGSPGFLLRALVVVPLAARMAEVAEEEHLDRLHAHYATHPALACWVVGRLTGLPWSFTAHAHDIYVDRTMLARKVADADFVTTISEANRQLLLREAGPAAAEKVRVVRCGVDPSAFGPGPRDAAPGRPFVVACVASLEPYKGHRHLLDAVARVRVAGTDLRLELVGDGELRTALEGQAARLGLFPGAVRFHGALPRPEVAALLRRADAAVLASVVTATGKREGIPVALMEAMASELPVVATRISGIPELVEDGASGLLVPPEDPAALAGALQRLAADPALRARLGAAGRRQVAEAYDLGANAARLAGLLHGVR